jgi:hypothetical protein
VTPRRQLARHRHKRQHVTAVARGSDQDAGHSVPHTAAIETILRAFSRCV